ncbi:HNH endonuclease signature motif containing protein [Arthrobacter sp. H-02-3]|uniref:HNH endonuclease signature motif containing protein n=1 Tax=Arthrobacter sp. H-02-3 TaxID=2703675 RepID=UPI001F29934A|nr:HNH endonuclease signature motif containing protein [Arthrobacter sp. H-02-3]
MEAARGFIPFGDDGQGTDGCTGRAAGCGADPGTGRDAGGGTDLAGWSGVGVALAALEAVGSTAVQDAALWDFRAAADFAGRVEELSRRAEFLQLVAAGAVDRTRKQSAAAARTAAGAGSSWTTGWRDDAPGTAVAGGAPSGTVSGAVADDGIDGGIDGVPGAVASPDALTGEGVPWDAVGDAAVVDDGYRNTAEFLRARLRISAPEAKRRLSLAWNLLPRRGLTGQPVPAVHAELGAAVAAGEVASRAATIITAALEKVRHVCDAGALGRMEHALTRTAAENDADFLARVARGWADALDQDGAEPSEELLRQLQGAFIRCRRHGLHHLEIFATTEQFEYLLTVMNTGTNPRTGTTNTHAAGPTKAAASEVSAAGAASEGTTAGADDSATGVADSDGWAVDATPGAAASADWGAEPAGASFAVGWAPSLSDGQGWVVGTPAGERSTLGPADAAGAGSEWPVTGAGAGVWACDARAGGVSTLADAQAASPAPAQAPAVGNHAVPDDAPAAAGQPVPEEDPGAAGLDPRSRAQRLLDGLVGACGIALATGGLPAAGGLRPQVMVTIDYRDLLARLGTTTDAQAGPAEAQETAGAGSTAAVAGGAADETGAAFRPAGAVRETGSLLFTGPVTASTVRKIACDADIIPVLLGGEGRILDIGRASRIFPPHLRKALIARDLGCAFPGCTIPAPWCEAHHITYWSRGGTTGTENGALLCSHHHHLIHKEAWTIRLRTGVPWFIPPPHIDPGQKPRRNHYFTPARPARAA